MTLSIDINVHYTSGLFGRKEIESGAKPSSPETGRIPRISRLMALALKFDTMLKNGEAESYADLARQGGVSDAYITQIMNLLNLSPEIQEELLLLPRVETGRAPIKLKDIQKLAAIRCWSQQLIEWRKMQNISV